MTLVVNFFVSLVGFYVVKNAVERDRRTGVGQILATTPMSKPLYTLGKALSNLAVLLAMVVVLAGMAVVAQWMAGEDSSIQLGPLLAPIVVFCVPAMALVAALAVLFETIPFLKGGFGNVVWFFGWVSVMPLAIKGYQDPFGMGPVMSNLLGAMKRTFGASTHGFVLGGISHEAAARTFRWEGMDWTAEILVARLVWILVAVGLTLVAALLFDRFDPSRWSLSPGRRRSAPVQAAVGAGIAGDGLESGPVPVPLHLHPLPAGSRRFSFLTMLKAELRLLLKGRRWGWYLVAAGLFVAGLAVPEEGRRIVLPLTWIWLVLLWSSLGSRESRFATDGLVFSAAWPLKRQLPATWLAGVLLALATGGGVGLRLLLTGHGSGLGAWLVGALFIPTFALALGVWSGSGKLFEVVYLLLWYIGPLNQTRPLDFMGVVPAAVRTGMPLVWLAITAGLGIAAVLGRQRQVAGDGRR